MIDHDDPETGQTILTLGKNGDLGTIRILHPSGTFALTPASLIALQAIGDHQERLTGTGIDWGSGTGCLAIAAARANQVTRVLGLEISEPNVQIARKNAALNRVANKVTFLQSDSYSPFSSGDRQTLEALAGQVDFIIANPPAS
ncbi:MAG: methyltransferase [Chloroflexota bacterium]|nr:methyltransferase [Chloroflexota bacterium]